MEYTFRFVEGMWIDQSKEGSVVVLSDVLSAYNMFIDDKMQFARLYDYEEGWCCWYRAYYGKITLTFWAIDKYKLN